MICIRKTVPVQVPETLRNLYDEVIADLKINELDSKDMKPFIVSCFKPFHAGSFSARTGAIIGIPWHFTYENLVEVKIPQILLQKYPVDVSRFETETLAESLVLSREAKKFAIAREVASVRDSNVEGDTIVGSAITFATIFFCKIMKKKFNLYQKPLMVRVALYTLSTLCGVNIYFQQRNFFAKRREKSIDEELAKLNEDYLKGGYEYYSKLLTTNVAQRDLLDKYGEKMFDANGNPIGGIGRKTTPVTERKSFFELLINANNA